MSISNHPHRPISYGALPHRRSLSATAFAAAIWLGLVLSVWAYSGEADGGREIQVMVTEPSVVLSIMGNVRSTLTLFCVD